MLLTIDVGNTETKLGIFDGDAASIVHRWRVTTDPMRTADEYAVFFTQLFATASVERGAIDAIAIASVVPKLDPALESVCTRYFQTTPRFLRPETQTLMRIATDRPSEVGADLVAAAIGARARFGAPLVVISYGTATAFTAIAADGAYVGAAIAPGIAISLDALIGRTAKLPQVAPQAPLHAIGRNTHDALQSGIVYGFVGQTEAIVARMRAEVGGAVTVVATGGLAGIVAAHTAVIDAVEANLSLEGLRLFAAS